MICYYCDLECGAGGTHLGVRPAIGVCADCGVGLCSTHARSDGPGTPLHCPELETRQERTSAQRHPAPA
jgi:hypothetical protein